MREYGNTRDRINSFFGMYMAPAYVALMYLGLSMVAYHPFTLGDWVFDDPWLLFQMLLIFFDFVDVVDVVINEDDGFDCVDVVEVEIGRAHV